MSNGLTDEERRAQVVGMMQDMTLSGATRGLMLFSARKRLSEALVARGWRKADMTDTARELAEQLQPARRA